MSNIKLMINKGFGVKKSLLSLLAVGFSVLLTACASNRLTNEQWAQEVSEAVTEWKLESVKQVTTFQLDSWASLGDVYLIVRTTPFNPYLLELNGRCPQLNFAQALMVNQSFGTSLQAGFDSVTTPQQPGLWCRIKAIYPLTRDQADQLEALDTPTGGSGTKS